MQDNGDFRYQYYHISIRMEKLIDYLKDHSILVRNNEKPCILFEQCVPLPLTESQHTVDTLAVSISVCA